jgi:putative transposase
LTFPRRYRREPMAKFKGRYRVESARLRGWDYAGAGAYFVTICTKDRAPFFGDVVDGDLVLSPIGQIVADEWQKTGQIRPYVSLDEWVIMPNHLHGIIIINPVVETPRRGVSTITTTQRGVPTTVGRGVSTPSRLQAGSLGAIVGQIKSTCTKRIRAAGFTDFAWQTRFYDHIVRDEPSLQHIREYIAGNPARWEEDRNNPPDLYM